MNTELNTQLVVNVPFTLRVGGRGRPVKGQTGEIFTIVAKLDDKFSLARTKNLTKSWAFTETQLNDWFVNKT